MLVINTSGVNYWKVEIKSTPANISQYIWKHTKKRDGLQRYKHEAEATLFIVLVTESLIATKTHLVKTRLARKRNQNKEGFLEGIRHCKFLHSNWN